MRWLLIPVLLFTVACGPSKSHPEDAGDEDVLTDEDGEAPVLPGFEADPEPEGAALTIDVDMTDPAAPVATVWAARLGPVFGIALHVAVDGAYLSMHDPVSAECVGTDSAGQAEYLAVARDDDTSLGAVRRGPDVGEVEINEPVVVATIPLNVIAPGSSRIELIDAQVRRADGSFTPFEAAGGILTTGGEP